MARNIHVQLGGVLRHRRGAQPRPAALHPLIRRAARAALRAEGVADAELSFTMLDDDAIAALNARFLQHDGPTDVIAFALYEPGEPPVGDVYLGFDQLRRNAAANGEPLGVEAARVAIHGTLHVLGHEHPPDESRVHSEMWRRQERILAALEPPADELPADEPPADELAADELPADELPADELPADR